MSRPEISVIVPTFGRQEQVRKAIRTALAQDADLEVIVVDDGSPQPIAWEGDERVRLLRLETNLGAAGARNAGAEEARGEWIAFLDSDDVWREGSLRPRLDAARDARDKSDATIWAAAFVDVWPDGRRGRPRVPKESASALDFAAGCWMCPGSTALMTRAAWVKSGGQDASLRRLEDYEWLLRWGLSGGRLAVHDGVAAEITRGGRATREAIDQAANSIRARHANVPSAIARRMESYLSLERGAALLHQGDKVDAIAALGQSWLLHPRLQPALERFWVRR